MKKLLLSATMSLALSSAAFAQDQCSSYVGKTIAPKTLGQAILTLNAPSPKGEFETSAAYEARVAQSNSTGPLIISKRIEGTEYLTYDADRSAFAVKTYLFDNTNFPAWETFYYAKNGIHAGTSNNIDIVTANTDTQTGSYAAQNGFGAKATIAKITRTIKAIFEREASSYKEDLFPTDDETLGYVPMSVERAKTFKQQAKIAFVVVPKTPYVTKASFSYGETTISNPTDITVNATVLNADIQCALLTDATNTVLAAFATR